MRRTICTYAVGAEKFRAMALSMLLSVREHAAASVDRYVVFTDSLNWRRVPDWIELVLLDCFVSPDRNTNWAIKPGLLSHPAVHHDLLLYLDSDTTIYSDVIGRCFDWIREHSLLVYMDFINPNENWGLVNLWTVYRRAGYEATNLKINAGIIGRAPNPLGRTMQRLYGELFAKGELKPFFTDEMYRRNDEPYLGLAVQLAFRELGLEQPVRLHDLTVSDYALTIGADPRMFRAKGGPVIRVGWYPTDIVRPAIVHWISSTQYLHFRWTLWSTIRRHGFLPNWFTILAKDELSVICNRIKLKARTIKARFGT